MANPVNKWLVKIGKRRLPILRESERALKVLEKNPHVTFADISPVAHNDPGLTLHLLAMANSHPRGNLVDDLYCVEHTGLLLGFGNVFDAPAKLPKLESFDSGLVKKATWRVICRSYHAAIQAHDWAVLRKDHSPNEIFVAALLNRIGEIALWCYLSEEAMGIQQGIKQGKTREQSELDTLDCTVDELGQALADLWKLPEFTRFCMCPESALNPRSLVVPLAADIARVTSRTWHGNRIVELTNLLADYLECDFDSAARRIRSNAVTAARETAFYPTRQAAALLPQMLKTELHIREAIPEQKKAIIAPDPKNLMESITGLTACIKKHQEPDHVLKLAMHGLQNGVGLNRVCFALLSKDHHTLMARFMIGEGTDTGLAKFSLDMTQPHLFSRLLEKQQSIWINDENRGKYWPMMPKALTKVIDTNSFVAMSIFVEGEPVGILYADRFEGDRPMDTSAYKQFQKLSRMMSDALSAHKRAA